MLALLHGLNHLSGEVRTQAHAAAQAMPMKKKVFANVLGSSFVSSALYYLQAQNSSATLGRKQAEHRGQKTWLKAATATTDDT